MVGLLLATRGHEADAAPVDRVDAGVPLEAPAAQPLPEWVEPDLPKPTTAELARLDGLVDQLLLPEAGARESALERLRAVDASWLPALVARFESLASSTNKPALKALLDRIRAGARQRSEEGGAGVEMRRPGKRTASAPIRPVLEALEAVLAHPDRSSAFLRPLTEVLAYARMFEAIGTWVAARQLISVYVRFGDFLRADVDLALARLGDGALAALIEAGAHPLPRVAQWAKQRLEDMGKLVASEAVQVQSPVQRADILRAYGKVRDVETARLLISYAASERTQLRLAARQAVAMLGEAGLWQLRDAYEKAAGRRAPSDWSWRRVAEELFAQFDRQRLSELYRLEREARQAEQRGDLDAARQLFDQILAYDPMFERGPAMAPLYIAFAQSRLDTDPEAATLALRRAERLAPSGPVHDRALSLRYTLDARALRERGIIDELLIQRARELDPENARAARLEDELAEQARGDRATYQRYLAAAVILLIALMAVGAMALKEGGKGPRGQGAERG